MKKSNSLCYQFGCFLLHKIMVIILRYLNGLHHIQILSKLLLYQQILLEPHRKLVFDHNYRCDLVYIHFQGTVLLVQFFRLCRDKIGMFNSMNPPKNRRILLSLKGIHTFYMILPDP